MNHSMHDKSKNTNQVVSFYKFEHVCKRITIIMYQAILFALISKNNKCNSCFLYYSGFKRTKIYSNFQKFNQYNCEFQSVFTDVTTLLNHLCYFWNKIKNSNEWKKNYRFCKEKNRLNSIKFKPIYNQ